MRKYNLILFCFLLVSIFSCTTKKKIGYFHNNYQRYAAKENPLKAPAIQDLQTYSATTASETALPNDISDVPVNNKSITEPLPSISAVSENKISGEEIYVAPQKLNPTKKEMRHDIRRTLKKSNSTRSGLSTFLLVIIAILLPPLAVGLVDGLRWPFWLSLILTIIFYLPGLIYALYRIFKK